MWRLAGRYHGNQPPSWSQGYPRSRSYPSSSRTWMRLPWQRVMIQVQPVLPVDVTINHAFWWWRVLIYQWRHSLHTLACGIYTWISPVLASLWLTQRCLDDEVRLHLWYLHLCYLHLFVPVMWMLWHYWTHTSPLTHPPPCHRGGRLSVTMVTKVRGGVPCGCPWQQ